MRLIFLCCMQFFFVLHAAGQRTNDIKQSIICQAIYGDDGGLTVSWIPKEGVTSYIIQYRTDLSAFWEIEADGVVDSFYTFSQDWDGLVEVSITAKDGAPASGYILTGTSYFEADQGEQMLIIMTDSILDKLEPTINEYRLVLQNELIKTDVIVVNKGDNVVDVKEQIVNLHNSEALDYILILGHVPVPYAGDYAIDGHTPDHEGAWVADGFYGDIDGNWTDVTINNEGANRDANKNIPGDGKFDQTFFPSKVEIPVGRVDFSDLPKLVQTEEELTKRYLLRNIAYRKGEIKATKRAIIDNNFNLAEGFAQGAIKSFHTFLEPDSINYGDFSQCTSQDYLFTYGAGGGSYQSASGIINVNSLVNDSIQSIFTTIFGSYFGDWDITNNLLRASLARGSSLINAWSGRPIWYFHQMAMGKPVGNIVLNTQNNSGNYTSQFGKLLSHISLLGDPSLKMYYHEGITNLVVDTDQISWEYLADDNEVNGFTIYYEADGSWILLGDGPRSEAFVDLEEIPIVGSTKILIRPVGLITSRAGSYYNEGTGVSVELQLSNTTEQYVESIEVYPNPAKEFITISGVEDIGDVVIYDSQGRVIRTAANNSEIYVGSLPAGPYLLHVGQQVVRFVKR